MKALMIEADAATSCMIRDILDSLGVELLVCEDAEAARRLIHEERPSLVILDQVLPGDDGFEFCNEVRDGQLPCAILIIASCRPSDCVDAMPCDCDDLVFRPLEPAYLRIRLDLALNRASQRNHERQVTRTAQALVKALETMRLGVAITDPDGRILFVNEAEAALHGYDVEELVGKNVRLFSPSTHWHWMTPEEMLHVRSWKRVSINVRKDGSLFRVQLVSDVIKDEAGGLIGLVTTCEELLPRSTNVRPAVAASEPISHSL